MSLLKEFIEKQRIGQERALKFVEERASRDRRGSLLAMYMGTGKTRVAIERIKIESDIARSQGKTLVTILACPCAVLPDPRAKAPGGWAGELTLWWDERDIDFYASMKGTTETRKKEIRALCTDHVNHLKGIPLIIAQSYDSWRSPYLEGVYKSICKSRDKFRVLFIMDESHRAKSPVSKTFKGCKYISDHCDHSLLLTGTPMPHSPMDLWTQFYCIDPDIYGDNFYRFRNKYCIMRDFGEGQKIFVGLNRRTEAELRERFNIGAYSLSLEDALDLPELLHTNVGVSLTPAEFKVYKDMEVQQYAELQEAGKEVSAANVLSMMLKLSQITGGAVKLADGSIQRIEGGKLGKNGKYNIVTSKGKALFELIQNDIPDNEPLVIFCRFKADMAICHDVCHNLGRTSYELSGSKKQLEQWRADDTPSVIVVQEQAGGVGIDLTRACHSIYYSVNYSLAEFDQSISRVHRSGQTRRTFIYHLIASGTIDEVIRRAIERKRSVVESVLRDAGIMAETSRHEESSFNWFGEDD